MGHAKRKDNGPVTYARQAARLETALDATGVEQILEHSVARDDGDPITGIRNALIGSLAFWVGVGIVATLIL